MGLFDKKAESMDASNMIGSVDLSRIEIPKMSESTNGKWVNWGDDNKYPIYLTDLYKTSALHRTLINNKSKLIAGKEILINDVPLDDWLATLSGVQSIRLQNLFYHSKYPIKDWLRKSALDYTIFGAFSTEAIWSNDFEYVKVLKHLDTSKIRSANKNKEGEIECYYFNKNWNWLYQKDTIKIATFDTENDQDLNQLIWKNDYTPNLEYYAEPSYVGGLTYINLDSELGLFNLSHIQNGLNPGIIFKVPFQFKNAEEKRIFIEQMMQHYKGAKNNKNPLFLSKVGDAEWGIEKVEVPEFDKQLIALGDFILQQLIFAHGVTNASLVGLETPGKLGNTDAAHLEFAMAKFNDFVIDPAREMFESTLKTVIKTHGLDVNVKIK